MALQPTPITDKNGKATTVWTGSNKTAEPAAKRRAPKPKPSAPMRSFSELSNQADIWYAEATHTADPEVADILEEKAVMVRDISGTSEEEMMTPDGVHAYFFENYRDDKYTDAAEEVRRWILNH